MSRPAKRARKTARDTDLSADFEVTAAAALAAKPSTSRDFTVDNISEDRRRILRSSYALPEPSNLENAAEGSSAASAGLQLDVSDWDPALIPLDLDQDDLASTPSGAAPEVTAQGKARRYISSVSPDYAVLLFNLTNLDLVVG